MKQGNIGRVQRDRPFVQAVGRGVHFNRGPGGCMRNHTYN